MELIEPFVALGHADVDAALVVVAVAVVATGYLVWRQATGRRVSGLVVGAGLALALGGATAVVLLRATGPDAVSEVLASIDGRALVGVLALQVLSSAALAQVYRATYLANGGDLRYRDALTVALGAFSLTQLLPAGGVAGGVYAMRRFRSHGADSVRATTTVLLVGLVTIGTLAIGLSVAMTVTALRSSGYGGYATGSVAMTGLVIAGFVMLHRLTRDGRARQRLADRLDRLRWRGRSIGSTWARSLERYDGLLSRPSSLLRPAGWSALNWSLDVAVLALLLRAVGADAPVLAVLVAFAVGNLLNGLPFTPGGIGVVEAGLAGTLVALGSEPAATSVAVLGYRIVAFWLPVVVAAPVVVRGLVTTRMPELEEVAG